MGVYIIMIGVQGAGKGTQAAILAEKYGIPHVSTGDLFRAMKTQDTPLAREVQALMNEGKLISDDITNRMVEDRLSAEDAQQGAIMDGYPRNPDQAAAFETLLASKGEKLTAVVVMNLNRDIAVMRSEGRRYSTDKSRVYNIYFKQPLNKKDGVWLDDETGEALIQRDDDQRDAIEKRISLYFEQTMPLIEYFQAKGLVVEIEANHPIENVTEAVMAAVDAKREA